MTEIDSEKIKEIIVTAGNLLISFQEKINNLKIEHKKNEGLVSNADKETENFLISEIKKLYPETEFIAEEDSFKSNKKSLLNEKLHWLIDPLDGTNNFLSEFDYYSISIAAYINGEVTHGWVYRPSTREMFSAELGKGSYYEINESKKTRITMKDISLSKSMLTTGFCVEKGQKFDREFEIFKSVMGNCRGIRRLGSAALDLCYSAKGPWNGFWERGLSPWDVAAGGLVVIEAGGEVVNYQGEKFSPFDSSIVASSPSAKADLLRLIGKI